MLPFKRGMEKIVDGTDVPIIPVHLDRLWGSIFSFDGGKFFWKWPQRIPYPVTVSFGEPLPSEHAARRPSGRPSRSSPPKPPRIASAPRDLLDRRLIRTARRNWNHFAMADTTGRTLTYGEMLTGARPAGARPAPRLPAMPKWSACCCPPRWPARSPISASPLRGRVPVNLNFTAGARGHGNRPWSSAGSAP